MRIRNVLYSFLDFLGLCDSSLRGKGGSAVTFYISAVDPVREGQGGGFCIKSKEAAVRDPPTNCQAYF